MTRINSNGYWATAQKFEEKFGSTEYQGKKYILTNNAEFAGVQNLRIDDSIYVLDENNYSASCIDDEGNKYIAYFVIKNEEDEENCCDWDHASYIQKI